MMRMLGLGGISYRKITSFVYLQLSVSCAVALLCFVGSVSDVPLLSRLTRFCGALSRSCCCAVHAHEAMCAMPPHVAAQQPQSQAYLYAGLGAFLSRGTTIEGALVAPSGSFRTPMLACLQGASDHGSTHGFLSLLCVCVCVCACGQCLHVHS